MTHCVKALLLGVALGTFIVPCQGAERSVKIGTKIENLRFKDIRYLTRSLEDLPKSKAYVLVFVNTTCPLVQRYLPRLKKMESEYRKKGVQFVAVNASADDSIRAMADQAVEYELEFPFVKDEMGKCAELLGVKRTPEVALLDASGRLCYRGRIDDQYRIGGTLPKPTSNDLVEALDAILAGKPVKTAETPVDGCVITARKPVTPNKNVTFAEHVAPILRKHCVECHQPGTAAPFSLITFEQTSSKANTIVEVVRDERMPPWYGSPQSKTFKNHRGLSEKERELIEQWVTAGKPRGDDSQLTKLPPKKTNDWRIGKPDVIIKGPEHELPAEGLIDYKYVVLPYVFLNDTWVQGVEILPDNPRVLHHCNMAYIQAGQKFQMSNFITGTVPGGEAMTLEKGVGYKIPAGSLLVLQIHYVSTGKKERCRLSVGLKYASGQIDKHLLFHLLVDKRFAIPPGASAHKVTASRRLTQNAQMVALFSHMHLRGRDMTFKAHLPNGTTETLLRIPNYNFDWQLAYRFETGSKLLPKGTRLEAVAHYDNSRFNPFNPDPKATVRDGQQTHQEMMNGFVFFVDANEKLNLQVDGKTGRVITKK